MQQDQYIYVCIHLHYYHPTSHHTNIISPHTHTHMYNIRMYITYITNCLLHPVHISLTHYQSDTPVHAHTYIHTNSPTITPPSLSYFLFPCCFSMLSLSLVKLLTCGVIRSYNCLRYFPPGPGFTVNVLKYFKAGGLGVVTS